MKLKHDELLSNFAFNCTLRHYTAGNNWLNDQLLSFYFAYLERDKYAILGRRGRVRLLDASVGFLIANMPALEVGEVVAPLKLAHASVVMFQVREIARVKQAMVT